MTTQSRLSNLRVVDPVLTNLARGYLNAEFIAEYLFPIVQVEKEAGKIPQFGKDAFKLYNTERAIRAKSNRINPEGITPIPYSCDEHDLEFPIDYREAAESALPLEMYATDTVTKGIQLRREVTTADLVQDPDNYPSGSKAALTGTDQWIDGEGHPIVAIDAGREAMRGKIGTYPNIIWMGAAVFTVLKNHVDILNRIKYTQTAIVTEDILARVFNVQRVIVGRAISADDTGAFTDVWGDALGLCYVPEAIAGSRSPYQPSFGYTLRKKGMPEVDTRTEDGKLELVRNTDIYVPKMVGPDAGYLFTGLVTDSD